jgi:hypothetical protein
MMVRMCSPSDADIGHSLWNVDVFFDDNPKLRKGQAKFLLVILPDTRCFDGIEVIFLIYQLHLFWVPFL